MSSKGRVVHGESACSRASAGCLHAGREVFAEEVDGTERVAQEAVADLAGDFDHARAEAGQDQGRRAGRHRRGREHRRHQGVGVEVAFEAQPFPGLPAVPDRSGGVDELPHPCCRPGPRHGVATFDVRLDLGAKADDGASGRGFLQRPGRIGQGHRGPRERDRDAGGQLEVLGLVGCADQLQERVVCPFRDPESLDSELLGAVGCGHCGSGFAGRGRVDLQRPQVEAVEDGLRGHQPSLLSVGLVGTGWVDPVRGSGRRGPSWSRWTRRRSVARGRRRTSGRSGTPACSRSHRTAARTCR